MTDPKPSRGDSIFSRASGQWVRAEYADWCERRIAELERRLNSTLAFFNPSWERPEALEVYCEGYHALYDGYPRAWYKLKNLPIPPDDAARYAVMDAAAADIARSACEAEGSGNADPT